MRKLVVILLIGVFYFGCVDLISAQVIINEVYPQPLSGELEWVELKNSSSVSAFLNGWVLEDMLSSPKTIYSFGLLEILPSQFFVATFSGQLNNNADGVVLRDSSGNIISQMSYSSSYSGLSWQLDNQGIFISESPTKGAENSVAELAPTPSPTLQPSASPLPTPTPSPTPLPATSLVSIDKIRQLQLLKVSSCPKGGNEWLEWLNTGEEKLLATLMIKDLQANNLSVSIEVEPGKKVITNLSRHIFNNSGDELFVYFNDQLLVNKNLPSCETADTIFSFSSDSNWPIEEAIENDDYVALSTSSPGLDSQAKTAITQPKVSKKLTKKPNFLLPTLESFPTSASEVVTKFPESSRVLGSTINEDLDSIFQFGWFLICGGFLWTGLGIIEIYGAVFSQNKAVG